MMLEPNSAPWDPIETGMSGSISVAKTAGPSSKKVLENSPAAEAASRPAMKLSPSTAGLSRIPSFEMENC
jgi:hypothetical protein